MTRRPARFFIVAIALGVLSAIAALAVKACPFCSAVQLTLAQEMKGADAVVVAELTELPPRPAGADSAFPPGIGEPLSKSKFRIVEVLKGANLLKNTKRIETIYLGDAPVGSQFLVTRGRSEIAFLGHANSADQAQPSLCRRAAYAA